VRAGLRALARKENVEFQLLLAEFGVERLLYRLGISPHAERYVLKGAMLYKLWSTERGRATWDLDMLGSGACGITDVVDVVRDLCHIPAPDAIVFDVNSIRGEEIRAADKYAGVRVRLVARLDAARIPFQVDVGFGDAVTPAAERARYPTLLEHKAPHIFVYPREAVVAEKLEAIVSRGQTTTRMKDFYDIHWLAESFQFEGTTLTEAIRATFKQRGTALRPEVPVVLTRSFLGAPERQVQWRAFLRRGRLSAAPDTTQMSQVLSAFFGPLLSAVADGKPFSAVWRPGVGWR
jgi:predicted nucleotidyltransferase component of viral defense system